MLGWIVLIAVIVTGALALYDLLRNPASDELHEESELKPWYPHPKDVRDLAAEYTTDHYPECELEWDECRRVIR